MAHLTIANPILGTGFELNAIAAVIIGGTSLLGSKGSLIGTFIGACIMGVGDFVRQIITGGVIIVAVILDSYRAKVSFDPVSSD
ncbi:inner-membrane translocator [Candidatus Vecturithrix granuli]|uniref:Inner-membrane translocator n=1 Tax=Vecturithrix granuli TaxID=1499967 RepID=A0A081BXD0_VECG1|nr:inner-membrane translocator [Candidatus Vecturithrix granuli]